MEQRTETEFDGYGDAEGEPQGEGVEAFGGAPISPGATAVESLLQGLNPAQQEAVEAGEGPLLILAGAGSGKTRVLTHRIAYLLATGMARPGEILAITFTNKAAGEMKERVASLVGPASRLMWVMTFHSACARILRQHADRLAYKRGFTIYDEADSRRMVKRCMDELDIDPKRFPPRSIKSQISGAKNRLRDAETLREEQGSFFEATVADVYEMYERRMHEANAMDFDDLLLRTVNLLELFPDLRERYQRQFRHVLVDEYQDTNRVQYRLLQLLTEEHGNLFVVGDDSQSIYGFRAAEVRNILDFERDFPEALTVKLEQNYRSTGTILDAANGLISHNRERLDKNLWTDQGRGDPVTIAELADEHEEARWVAGEIDRLVDEQGYSRDDVAVFYRTNAQSRVLEDTLVRFDVPYQVIGGTKFYERAEIKDAIAYMTVLANPADGVALGRIINSPRRGIGQTSEGRLLAFANTNGVSALEAVEKVDRVPGMGAAAVKAIGRFGELIASLTERAERRGPVAELLESVLSESGYIEALEAERTVEAEGRIENLQELIGMAGEFDANRELEGDSELPPLEEFLEQISLVSEQDALVDDGSKVTLMTLHNAKGLEYDAVFMIGCEDGVFPHSRSVDEGNLEEERRLCYVGLTRARKLLTLTYARRRMLFGQGGPGVPSRFLGEIPSELVERHSTAPAMGWGSSAGRSSGGGYDPLGSAAGSFKAEPRPALDLAVGDDIVHAAFGEGVITAVDGDQLVVRFRKKGDERRLMADFAPIQKAS
ncbi:MAG: UvrD-helicase domain-containing protein [Solirubrobacterales bacterium]